MVVHLPRSEPAAKYPRGFSCNMAAMPIRQSVGRLRPSELTNQGHRGKHTPWLLCNPALALAGATGHQRTQTTYDHAWAACPARGQQRQQGESPTVT
jgi:hypothetical protein